MDNCTLISFEDNQSYENAYLLVDDNRITNEKTISESYWEDIKKIRDVNNLLNQRGIITIPAKDKYRNNEIFSRVNDKIFTYNWVGVLNSRNDVGMHYRIEINSRFDKGNKQYFLLYLLSSVCGISIFDINVNSETESDYTTIIVLLFLEKLVAAFEDGVYKEYIKKRYNEYNFKGTLDINRHIRINNPFMGKTAYSTREYSYDNDILCLIRQALEYIIECYPSIWKGYLDNNVVLNEILDVIETATPSYRMNVNYVNVLKCRKVITHPMYQKYEDTRKIALMILQEAGQNVFDNKEEESFGILIDISWLWEEFIGVKLLDHQKYHHLLTDKSQGYLEWSDNEYWYPDFIEINEKNTRRNVFDAKYKFWEWNKDVDIHQLLSYLYLTGGETCGIIYPSQDKLSNSKMDKEINAFSSFYEKIPKIYKLPFFIPQSENIEYIDYCKQMENSINDWQIKFSKL